MKPLDLARVSPLGGARLAATFLRLEALPAVIVEVGADRVQHGLAIAQRVTQRLAVEPVRRYGGEQRGDEFVEG